MFLPKMRTRAGIGPVLTVIGIPATFLLNGDDSGSWALTVTYIII